MPWFEEKDGDLILRLRVNPRASRNEIAGPIGDALKIRIQAAPVDGSANSHLIRYLSKNWDVPRRNLTILSGHTGRDKRLGVTQPDEETRNRILSSADG